MENKIPFTSYDFWAYLSAGFALLFALDTVSGQHLVMRDSWTVVQSVIAITVAYVIGHLVAGASSLIFERWLVGGMLGNPRDNLLGQYKAHKWLRRCLPGYFKQLPDETKNALSDRAKKLGPASTTEGMFSAAHVSARAAPPVASRLDNFLNIYGFCRNVALVGLLDASIFYWSYLQKGGPHEHLLWARLSLLIGFGMLVRYLKFYRLFAYEVFTSWAHSADKETGAKP